MSSPVLHAPFPDLNWKDGCASGCVVVDVADSGVIDEVDADFMEVADAEDIDVVSRGQRFGEETTLPSEQTYSFSTAGSLRQPPVKRTKIKSRAHPRMLNTFHQVI